MSLDMRSGFNMNIPDLTAQGGSELIGKFVLRPQRGVCEAHLHQSYKPCVIGAIPSQTYGKV